MHLDVAAIFNAVPDACLVLDINLMIVAVTDRYTEVTMTRREEILGRSIFDVFPDNPDDPDATGTSNLRASLNLVLASGTPHEMPTQKYDIPQRPERGGGFAVRYWKPLNTPVLVPSGEVAWIIHRVVDVTAAELRRQEGERRYNFATKVGGLGTWEWHPADDVLQRSSLVDEVFGFRPEEAGRYLHSFLDRIHPDDLGQIQAAIAAAEYEKTVRLEYRVRWPDGTTRWVKSRGVMLAKPDGTPDKMVGVLTDITGEKEREAALESTLRERDELLAQQDLLVKEINHRVKNSLQMVSSLLSLQSRRVADPEAKSLFDQAIARIGAIASIHENLYQHDDALTIEMEPYLTRLGAELQRSIAPSGQPSEIMIEADPVTLPVDTAVPLALISNELLTNALKYAYPASEAGIVRLQLRRDVTGVISLTVSDSGPGLTPCGTGARVGLGTKLVRGMAKQIGAEVITRDLKPGYSVTVQFRA